MSSMRRLGISGLLAALVVALASANALADSVATTDPATSVGSTNATLNGHATPPNSDSTWFFQYAVAGSSQLTSTQPTTFNNTNPQSVSFPLTGLTPGTTYAFRLVVSVHSYPSTTYHTGDFVAFTTTSNNNTAVATTGNATQITKTSAVLNGVVNTTNPDSAWAFNYGTTTAYGQNTAVHPVGAGVTAVSIKITGLKAHIVYHYRLVVVQGSYPSSQASFGADRSFIAQATGKLSLRGHKLRVKHGVVFIRLRCKGKSGAKCTGLLSLSIKRSGKKPLSCASGAFTVKSGKHTVKKKLSSACRSRLHTAKGHHLKARFTALVSGSNGPLKASVTLFS